MAGDRRPKGATTRAAILDRAVDLASIDGLDGLTIGRLAAELEMSKSGLFAHFGSKQELQLATVEAAAARFREAVIDPAADAADGAPRHAGDGDRVPHPPRLRRLLGRLLLGGDLGRVRRSAGPGARRDRRRAGRLARRARAPGADRRGRRPRAPRLRALRGGHGRQLALPPLRRPARLRLRPQSVERLLAELPADERGAPRSGAAADFARRFAEFWAAPAAGAARHAARRAGAPGGADDARRPTRSPTGNGPSPTCCG